MTYIGTEIFRQYDIAKEKFPDFDTWTSEAIREEFGEELRDALMAAKICKTTTLPWGKPDVFEKVALVLNGRAVIPDVIQDVSMKEITFAVQCLDKEFQEETGWSNDMILYFTAEADEEGMYVMPPCLDFVPRHGVFLNEEQQHIQNEYLEECKVYSEYLWKVTEGKLPFSVTGQEA